MATIKTGSMCTKKKTVIKCENLRFIYLLHTN